MRKVKSLTQSRCLSDRTQTQEGYKTQMALTSMMLEHAPCTTTTYPHA